MELYLIQNGPKNWKKKNFKFSSTSFEMDEAQKPSFFFSENKTRKNK